MLVLLRSVDETWRRKYARHSRQRGTLTIYRSRTEGKLLWKWSEGLENTLHICFHGKPWGDGCLYSSEQKMRKRHCKGRVWDSLTRQRAQYHCTHEWAWNRLGDGGTGRRALVSVLRDLSLQNISQKTSSHQALLLEGVVVAHHCGFQSDHCLLSR